VLVTVTIGSENRSAVVSIETGEVEVVEGLEGARGARCWGDKVVYAMGDELFVAPFDWKRRKLTGSATMLQNDVFVTRGGPFFSLAGNGTLAFVPGSLVADENHVVWADRSGTVTRVNEYLGQHLYPRLSPDGRRVAVQEGSDVWVYDERGTRAKLTERGGTDPVWNTDGRSVTFAAFEGSYRSIQSVAADGSNEPAQLFSAKHSAFPHSWSPDGQALAIYQVSPDSARDIFVLRRNGTTFVVDSFLVTKYNERSPAFSTDGKWIAYVSDESGTDEIYVRPYPNRGGKWTISRGGGREPVWGRDGKTLYFRRGNEVLSLNIELRDGDLSPGEPRVVTTVGGENFFSVSGSQSYDVSPDGQRLLTMSGSELSPVRSLRVVVGWLKP
jgi:Tol biopolymer transport system component